MVPSSDMLRTNKGSMALRTYYRATQEVTAKLAAIFKVIFSEDYNKPSKLVSGIQRIMAHGLEE